MEAMEKIQTMIAVSWVATALVTHSLALVGLLLAR